MSLFSARNPLKPSFALPGTGQCSRKSSSLRERLALDIGHGTRSLSNLGDVNRSVQKGVGKGRCHYSRVPCRPLLYSTLLYSSIQHCHILSYTVADRASAAEQKLESVWRLADSAPCGLRGLDQPDASAFEDGNEDETCIARQKSVLSG